MTVQDLIDRLQKVENKSKDVVLYTAWVDSDGTYDGNKNLFVIRGDIAESADSFIIEGCVVPW